MNIIKNRCRHGYFHVVNNDYTHWEMYAIGGSANPTINSQGNRFLAPRNRFAKEVSLSVSQSVYKVWISPIKLTIHVWMNETGDEEGSN